MAHPVVPPHLFVVFGATGDLMQRKLLPALYRLHSQGRFPLGSVIVGVARHPMDDGAFREMCATSLVAEKAGAEAEVGTFCRSVLFYQTLSGEGPTGFPGLRTRVEKLEAGHSLPGNRIFYLALPLEAFAPTLQGLGEAGLNHSPGWTRVVIEKPFGRDLDSAVALNALAHRYFEEKQIYRIDHYLGKETVQNLLVFRLANAFVESDWNRDRVDHVEITVAESLGVEGRAGYYETAGALRDMIQNHVTQVLTLVAMEPPARRNEDDIRDEKVKVLRSALPIRLEDVVRGQYGPGTVEGVPVPGYRQEPDVSPNSTTETYIALCLRIANWRWHDVPFFVRTGKRLPAKSSRVVVTFKAPPVSFFQSESEYAMSPDRITILLQPEEGFEIAFEIKVPGREMRVQTHRMKFHYADVFGPLPDGYDTLVEDVMIGDASLFVRADEVEESWRLYGPILAAPPPVVFYPAGSDGPEEGQRLAASWGHRWSTE
ncbi:MAG: glucose-6-phosphate dehydrogenase [Thermoplasmata archaeon]|nr:glucose-6-phosphate dehydrogenase [Thermoplasmata archaeon]